METFDGRIAVVTGGGSGMGRELAVQLAHQGCHVATCDQFEDTAEETRKLASEGAPAGTSVSAFRADVTDESQILSFRDSVASELGTDHIDLLFNNAGMGGGGSFVSDRREEWDHTFAVDWSGVYLMTRAFLPMLLKSDEGHLVNTSSVNGFFASIGPRLPHTAYSTAKFAIRGFTEALIADFRVNAPHLHAHVVMPGHIGTSIVINTAKALGRSPQTLDDDEIQRLRKTIEGGGVPLDGVSDDDLRMGMQMMAERFRDNAPLTAAGAATVILDGVRQDKWRILVGDDAVILDEAVRADPEHAYEVEFFEDLRARGVFGTFQL
ncbi:MAG: SDR family oxidoreductase [Acidimicrobiales bacterium]|jgi:NAD(P)-dependent dehydrogenase (short-subunit alcohol dehydrogenase family)